MPTSEYYYFGLVQGMIIAKPTLSSFVDLPNLEFLLRREILSNDLGHNSTNSINYLYNPIYMLINVNGSRRFFKNGKFTLIDFEADKKDYITHVLIGEDGAESHHYKLQNLYTLSDESGAYLFKEIISLFNKLNHYGSWKAFENESIILELKEKNEKLTKEVDRLKGLLKVTNVSF